MKASELRNLIREEIRKVIREGVTKVPSDGIVRDNKGKPQISFTKKGTGTEVKAIATGKTFITPMSVDQAYNKLFSTGQIFGNDGSSFNGKMHKTFNDDFYDLDPSDWKRFLTAPAAIKPGTRGEDINMYPLTVVAGPFDSFNAIKKAIEIKYPKAVDILQDEDFVSELENTNVKDVEGLYLVKGPDYGGSGFTVVNGEDITLD